MEKIKPKWITLIIGIFLFFLALLAVPKADAYKQLSDYLYEESRQMYCQKITKRWAKCVNGNSAQCEQFDRSKAFYKEEFQAPYETDCRSDFPEELHTM